MDATSLCTCATAGSINIINSIVRSGFSHLIAQVRGVREKPSNFAFAAKSAGIETLLFHKHCHLFYMHLNFGYSSCHC
jgi:hypothetical protein